jgi:hypothetical protein
VERQFARQRALIDHFFVSWSQFAMYLFGGSNDPRCYVGQWILGFDVLLGYEGTSLEPLRG